MDFHITTYFTDVYRLFFHFLKKFQGNHFTQKAQKSIQYH